MKTFETLSQINVNDKTEKKGGLTYLSWSWAWAEFKKVYPEATYRIIKGEDGKPYISDETGYMVFTEVSAGGLTHEMWLPVMDYRNKSLKIGEATSFDINKTIMRCLTKNLAMFGLGLYIYAGEDLPETSDSEINRIKAEVDKIKDIDELRTYYSKNRGKGKEIDAYITAKSKELSK